MSPPPTPMPVTEPVPEMALSEVALPEALEAVSKARPAPEAVSAAILKAAADSNLDQTSEDELGSLSDGMLDDEGMAAGEGPTEEGADEIDDASRATPEWLREVRDDLDVQ